MNKKVEIKITRWERRLPIDLKQLYFGTLITCCDCGLQHFYRIEGDVLVMYPVRPKGYKYPEEKEVKK